MKLYIKHIIIFWIFFNIDGNEKNDESENKENEEIEELEEGNDNNISLSEGDEKYKNMHQEKKNCFQKNKIS